MGERTHHLVHAFGFELANQLLIEQRALDDQHFFRARLQNVFRDNTTEHSLAELLHDVTTLNERSHGQAAGRTAIDFGDDQVLCHVDEAAGQVTRVRRLQRGVGQTLTSAVRRDEVLQNVQTFTEVRRDGRLDDRAVRLGHQSAHTGKLSDLRSGTARTGVSHHEDRVERLLLLLRALGVHSLLRAELLHHDLRHLVVRT